MSPSKQSLDCKHPVSSHMCDEWLTGSSALFWKCAVHACNMTSLRPLLVFSSSWIIDLLDLCFNSFPIKASVFGFLLGNRINTLSEVLHSLTMLVSYQNILTLGLAWSHIWKYTWFAAVLLDLKNFLSVAWAALTRSLLSSLFIFFTHPETPFLPLLSPTLSAGT